MKIILDCGKHWLNSRHRFLNCDDDIMFLVLKFITFSAIYSYKHKCFIMYL